MKFFLQICLTVSLLLAGEASTHAKSPIKGFSASPAIKDEQTPIRHLKIREVSISGKRPMKEIGVQKTLFDSTVLQENIALSMADVLTFNSSIFVKNYGRATLSTVAFRGTSPSHTQVTWNDMKINNPMLGMTDFSMIPAYFIDKASLLHGTSSVQETGGGLGGAVKLQSTPPQREGFNLQFVQGIGSFETFDEFLRLSYASERWKTSTRVVYSSSENNFKYRNHDKKEVIYDDNHQIIGSYYPTERNKHASFKDFHLLQEVYYHTAKGDRFGLNAWYIHSNRELPMLTVDYADDRSFENRQREHTLRSVASWEHLRKDWKVGVKMGYIHTWMGYDHQREKDASSIQARRTRSKINTFFTKFEGEYSPSRRWLLTADLSLHYHDAFNTQYWETISTNDEDRYVQKGEPYDKDRVELSGSMSAKWRASDRFGLSLVLREEKAGKEWAPLIPAFFMDGVLSRRGNLIAKASISRNHRFPTLNDLYFLPGGNPQLKSESGWTYDVGLSFETGKKDSYRLKGGVNWFDSHIDDWIIWLPTPQGFFSPKNIKKVHAYGVEMNADWKMNLGREWQITLNGTFSWTPSVNEGKKVSENDHSILKQLPYVPEYSSTLSGRLKWRTWSLLYKWCYYSQRYTMSSNAPSLTGYLPPYYMNNLSLEKIVELKWADLSIKGAINNLFDEEYLSVLSRPMPGINFEIFIGITPKW